VTKPPIKIVALRAKPQRGQARTGAQRIYEALRHSIIVLDVEPGTALEEERLCRRYRKLARAGKSPTVVTTAIARELAGFVWAIARQV